jgi:hypothetical protein
MSIKLTGNVWENDLIHSEQSVLLAMADYADDDGRNCYPSYDRLAWKTGYSKRQVGRIIQGLCANGIVVILKPSNQRQSTHYWLRLDKAEDKEPFRVDISDNESSVDNLTTLDIDDDSSMDNLTTLDDSRVDISDTANSQGGQMEHLGWTSETSSVDMVSPDPSVNHQLEPEEEEDTPARDALHAAWFEHYQDEMPSKLEKPFANLALECGEPAAIYSICAGAEAGARNFEYFAKCARNYIPPAPSSNHANGNGYSLDLPGAALPPVNPSPPPLPPPMATDDPWAIALAELGQANMPWMRWLAGSHLLENGVLAGEPFYRVVLTEPGANAEWVTQQAEPAIRKKLSSILHKRISLDIVAAPHLEPTQ